jgi:hypothetical protein
MIDCCVVIPTFRPQLLKEAVASVLDGSVMPDEFRIMRDGGSWAGSELHSHPAARINEAIWWSQCPAIVVLGDDDKLDPTFLAKTLREMEEQKVDIVYTDMQRFGLINDVVEATDWTQARIEQNPVPFYTSLFRKSIWEKVGGFHEVTFYDWDFWWRCFDAGATAYHIHEPLFHYRIHEGNQNVPDRVYHEARVEVLRKHGVPAAVLETR